MQTTKDLRFSYGDACGTQMAPCLFGVSYLWHSIIYNNKIYHFTLMYHVKNVFLQIVLSFINMKRHVNKQIGKNITQWVCFLVTLLTAHTVCGNGDPVAVRSAITLSPTPVAVHVPEVQLVDEVVSFVPRERYMEVTVRYLLHNKSARSFDKLPYGFPIDYFGSGEAQWVSLDEYSESDQEVGWRDSYIRNVCFTMNGKQLSWQCSRDTIITPSQPYLADLDVEPDSADGYSKKLIDSLYALYGDEIYFYTKCVSRRWFYTYLNIPANSFVTLEVRYTVECALSEGAYNRVNNLIHYEPNYYWHLRFQYDFTPAAYWGDGHADHFAASLDASAIKLIDDQRWLRAQETRAVGIGGLPMNKKGTQWEYETTRFNLATAQPFTLDYKLTNPPHQPLDRLLNHRISPSEYTIEVSGADKKYPIGNLSDLNPGTTTVLRPDPNDSLYITLRFKKPTVLEGMLLLNGYTKNAETHRNNSRIDSLIVLGKVFYVYEIDGIRDSTPLGEYVAYGRGYSSRDLKPDKCSSETPPRFDWQTLADNAVIVKMSESPWGDSYYTEIRILITATRKGLKYDDLCLSEILLIGK